MKALRLVKHGWPGTYQLGEVNRPECRKGDALVRVQACGLNHLDLWLEKGELPVQIELPRVPGGEVAGVVEELGSEVDGWERGDRVVVQSNLFCGECEFCLQGEESVCLKGELLGVQWDGGLAELVRVPARSLVRLPEELSFVDGAALTLAGSTAMHLLTHQVQVKAGHWVLVMAGASGVGVSAIQIALEQGAYVIAAASSPEKRALCKSLGAHAVVDSSQADWSGEVRRITEKRGVDLVVEHVGAEVWKQVLKCLARNGTILTCGATTGAKVELDLWPFFVKQQRLIGSYGRNRADIVRTLEWAAEGKLHSQVDRVVSLADAEEGLAALRERRVKGKVVVGGAGTGSDGGVG